MRGFGALLLLAVAVFSVYTYTQVTRLRAEVTSLRVAVAERREGVKSPSKDARSLLNQAAENLKRARLALDSGQPGNARKELDTGLRKVEEASKLADSPADRDVAEAWQSVKGQLDKLWAQFAKESRKK